MKPHIKIGKDYINLDSVAGVLKEDDGNFIILLKGVSAEESLHYNFDIVSNQAAYDSLISQLYGHN